MRRFGLILVVTLAAFGLVFATGTQEGGGGATASAGYGPQSGGVLVFARSGDSVGLDPARETDGESFYGSTQVSDTLVEFVPGTTEVQPAPAPRSTRKP